MLRILKNQKGSIGIAIVVAIIAVLSGVSLSSVAFRDTLNYRVQLDAVQELHLLRTEIGRGRLMVSTLEGLEFPPPLTVLPIRNISLNYGRNRTVYTARTKLRFLSGGTGAMAQDGFKIESLISAVRGTGQIVTDELKSPVKRYGENHIRSLQTLAIFHYFSDKDLDASGEPGNIRFYGPDVVHGRVHSNTDIYIRQAGGGNNNGWPTFHGLVSTAGKIRVFPGGGTNFPEEQIFRGGLIEEYPRVVFEGTAELVRRNGLKPFGSAESDERIYVITVDGASYSGYRGEIRTLETEDFPVYNSYPPYGPIGTQIAVNSIALKDTLWFPTVGDVGSNNSVWVPGELWLSGIFRGRQTWASSHNIYLKDNLRLEGTALGAYPDEGPNGDLTPNTRDFLGILSEKHVLIQYGYMDPEDGIRKFPNTNSISIYAAVAAMGKGNGNNHEDGVFSFQYQFPKGSTPDQMYNGQFYTKIDLYRYRYPTSPQYPWPPQLDYPWYNPVWPQPGPNLNPRPNIPNPHGTRQVSFLRGNINLYGSVAQRRRGFVRRSGNVDFDNGIWALDDYIYGAPPNQPSGYDKNYYFDTRFEGTGPPDFPLVKFEGYTSDELMDLGYETVSWVFKKPPSNF